MLYSSVHFICRLRLPDSHCLTCLGTYTKVPPMAEVWGEIQHSLIPLWWAHVKMVLPFFCRIWQNVSYKKGKDTWAIKSGFFPLFVFGNERRWDIGKWGKYYAASQSLFPPMSQMPMFPFSGTYSNFKIKSCGKIHSWSKYCVSQIHSVREASTNPVICGLFSFCFILWPVLPLSWFFNIYWN